jgi:hypothetical protein
MSVFPVMLYKSPGIHKKPGGGTYTYIGVQTQEEFNEKTDAGWFESSAEAIESAGDKATPVGKPKPKWAIKPIKKKKPAKPLDWREKAKADAQAAAAQAAGKPEPVIDDAAPTRTELEAKATELGIRFDGRTKDKKLGQLIQDKLSEPTAGE